MGEAGTLEAGAWGVGAGEACPADADVGKIGTGKRKGGRQCVQPCVEDAGMADAGEMEGQRAA